MCHLSLIGQLIQFGAQHLVVIACLYILYANRDLPAQRLRLGTYIPDYLGGKSWVKCREKSFRHLV